ncbi:MAG: WecB/TagA/CpsF family glycosyltransferase [Candidatus Sumerlaeia bacterium]|nr:WecB/TagA/CpsF family glycosyltransferase [Candidatus Sumerlaeia bacterium]
MSAPPPVRGRAWRLAGRLASPASALALALLGRRRAARDVLAGRRTLVGPSRPLALADGSTLPGGAYSEHRLSERMNLDADRAELDGAYARRLGPKADFAILLRALWASTLDGREAHRDPGDHFNLFGIVVNNSETPRVLRTVESLVDSHPNFILQSLPEAPTEPAAPAHVAFVNANNLNLAVERPDYRRALAAADLILPDGIGVKIALRMAGGRLRKNLNGTDLFAPLAELFARRGWPVFLLGGTAAVLARAESNIARANPSLRIAGTRDGYFAHEDEAALCEAVAASGAMALLIGMGTPRQELFVARNAHRLRVPLVLSMGGLLDFLGGKNKRAPLWMRQAGLEWVFRIIQEPGRMWRRYVLGNPVFLWRARRWIRSQAGGGHTGRRARA